MTATVGTIQRPGDDLLDRVEPELVAQVLEAEAAPVRPGLLALAGSAGEGLSERALHQRADPMALGDGHHLGLDAAGVAVLFASVAGFGECTRLSITRQQVPDIPSADFGPAAG
jgi:hypothetical protein